MLINVVNSNFELDEIVFNFRDKALKLKVLNNIVSTFRSKNKSLKEKTVLVRGDEQEYLILSLVCLAGFAKKIVLLPGEVDIDRVVGQHEVEGISILELNDKTFEIVEGQSIDFSHENSTEINTLIVLATSGTSGVPKLIEHGFDFLTASMNFNLTKEKFVWGQVYKVNRFAGLQVLLQALHGGNRLVLSSGDYNVEDDVTLFAEQQVNCISATPTYWRKMLMVAGSKMLDLRNITLGGELSSQSILDALKAAFPKTNIRHIYASTEAGFGFSVSDCREGFPKSWIDSDVLDISLAISEDNELLVKKNIESQSYVDLSDDWYGDYFKTGDLVDVVGDRVLFLGRKSGLINIGGMKLLPEKVETAIMSIEGVSSCHVHAIKSSMMGSLVGADVVRNNDELTAKDIKLACQDKLLKHEIPVKIKFVEHIELTNTGKVKRS